MKPVVRLCVGAGVVLLLAPAPGVAQQTITSASVSGRVLDPAGAGVAYARVALRSLERNQSQVTETGGDGRFRFLSVPVGVHELVVSAGGFATRVVTLALAVGQAVDIPVTLDLASLVSRVDVAGSIPIVEVRRTQIADLITPAEMDQLPLNGRNYVDLALLTPAVTRTVQRNTERFAETSAVPGTGISVAGQRNLNNTFLVDGLSANDDAAGLAGTYFAEEVIREFQVVTSGGIAEFGRASAGIVNVVTHSGGNARHGRIYGYFRDDALDARNAFAAREDPLQQAQFGVTASGPVRRDRTFWFANVESTRLQRTGIVSIADANAAAVNSVLAGTAYQGLPVTRGEFATGYDTANVFGRVDHAGSPARRRALRYSLYDVRSENARSVGGLNAESRGTRLDNRDQTVALNWTSTSTAAVHESRAQATRSRLAAPPNDLVGPAVNIAGIASFGTSTTAPTGRDLDVFEGSHSVTVSRGTHLLKAGGVVLYERLMVDFPGAVQGVYAFSSLATFQVGRYTNFQQAFGEPSQFQSSPNVGLFVQDEWRPRDDVTINGGVRYDLQGMPSPITTDTDNVSPRFGVAFAPRGGHTVVRGSAGLYFDRVPLRAISNALQRDGQKYAVALLSFGQSGAPVFPARLQSFPDSVLTNITTMDPDIQSGVARQGSVQVERQLGEQISMSLGYLHLTGRNIIMSRNVNVPTLTAVQAAAIGDRNLGRPDPRFGNNAQFQSIGRSRYDGVTLTINIRRSPVGSLRAAYTRSRSLDDAGNAFFSTPQDNVRVRDDWGPSDNDQRHRVTLSGATRKFIGLQLAYVFAYASAPPFNVQTGTDRNNDTNANDRPAGLGRNTGRGFDSSTLDLRLGRSFGLPRGHRLDLTIDAFNALNRPNYVIPNNIFGPGTVPPTAFGEPTAAGDPRQVQIGVRWAF